MNIAVSCGQRPKCVVAQIDEQLFDLSRVAANITSVRTDIRTNIDGRRQQRTNHGQRFMDDRRQIEYFKICIRVLPPEGQNLLAQALGPVREVQHIIQVHCDR